MDFLNKVKQEVDRSGQKHSARQDTAQDQENGHETKHEAESKRDFLGRIIAGSGHRGTHHAYDDSEPEKLSLVDRLTHKEEREKKAAELAAREAELKLELERVAHEKKENEGFFERIKDHFDGDEDAKVEPERPEHHEGASSSFFDKLTGKEEREKKAAELKRKEAELHAELERVEHEKRENEGLLQRLKDHLDGEEAEPGKGSDKPSLLDKITGKAAEEERLRKEEENKSSLEKMRDRLNERMGGGREAEKKEDLLDKTIDKFQEHVLRQGTQSDESAWEQVKDDKIADALRGQLHLKNKEEK